MSKINIALITVSVMAMLGGTTIALIASNGLIIVGLALIAIGGVTLAWLLRVFIITFADEQLEEEIRKYERRQ